MFVNIRNADNFKHSGGADLDAGYSIGSPKNFFKSKRGSKLGWIPK
jgi:hypothetical protein